MPSWADIALQSAAPSNPNMFGINSGSSHYADETTAAITRANWAQARPELSSLIDRLGYMYSNPEGRQEMIQSSAQQATQGVEQARTDFQNNARSTGLSLAPDQQAAVTQRFDDAARVAKIDAMNRGSSAFDDMRNQIALGG